MLELVFGAVVFLAVAYITKEFLRRFDPKLPPGLWGLPVLGYAPFLGGAPHEDYRRLKKKYGPVFGYHHGSIYTVVLNDYPSIKEAFNKEEFLDRPGWFHDFWKEHNVNTMNGWEWKEMRRFVLSTFRTLGMGKNKVEEGIKGEISIDMEKLAEMGSDEDVNTADFFFRSFANTIFSIINGFNGDEGNSTLQMMKRFKNVFSEFNPALLTFFFPVLKVAFSVLYRLGLWKESKTEELDNYLKQEIEQHEKNFDPSNKEDFFDYYIEEMRKHEGRKTSLTRARMFGNAKALLLAATETTQCALDWVLQCLAKYPEAQERIYQEIVDLLGKERPPSWSDRDSLHYTNAFINEVERFKTLGPASDPHWSSRAGTISGYHIPKDTMLLANIYAVHMDETLWGDPRNFRPERFLSSKGHLLTPEYFMPFLIGKRMCPGDKLAIMQVFLFVASLVQKFEIRPPKSGVVTLEENLGLIVSPANPVVRFVRRQ